MSESVSKRRALVRASGLALWTLLLLLPAMLMRLLLGRVPYGILRLWHRSACRMIGLDLRLSGRIHACGPTLFVANHVSYLDILLLGSALRAGFIAKSEVSRWPVIGFLARLIGTVFVERRAQSSARQRDMLSTHLARGENLVLFAEGTSSDGRQVLPFKSSLFGALERCRQARTIAVQPVTIHYSRLKDGMPAAADRCRLYAWYGDMTLLPHLWTVLGLPGVTVRVHWHEPIARHCWTDRKDLTRQAHRKVTEGLARLQAETELSGGHCLDTAGKEAVEIALGGPVH